MRPKQNDVLWQHGYGLLLHDMVDEYLVNMYGLAAGGMTPGTWTAAECWTPAGDWAPEFVW